MPTPFKIDLGGTGNNFSQQYGGLNLPSTTNTTTTTKATTTTKKKNTSGSSGADWINAAANGLNSIIGGVGLVAGLANGQPLPSQAPPPEPPPSPPPSKEAVNPILIGGIAAAVLLLIILVIMIKNGQSKATPAPKGIEQIAKP